MSHQAELSRRRFLQLSTAAAVASSAVLNFDAFAAATNGPATLSYSLDQDWLFGGRVNAAGHIEGDFTQVTLPHCVAKLSWQKWDEASWQAVWAYRRGFALPKEFANRRVFVKFDGVLVTTTPAFNGQPLKQHHGGYLPFTYELTSTMKPTGNVLDVGVDSRWQNVPPDGSPKGTHSVDYFEPGGIFRSVSLQAMPQVFIADVFAKPVGVLKPSRHVEILCTIDAATFGSGQYELKADLMDGTRVVSSDRQKVDLKQNEKLEASLTLTDLSSCKLWDVDDPQLYTVVTTLLLDGKPLHDYRNRIGFREASFTVNGFFLNGRKMQFFGLNRHEIYPYVGMAMPPRVMRHDAEILKRNFNCNMVRCSHYPQNEAFLDACDELGLMVWQETPGWGYLGAGKEFQDHVYDNVHDMVIRDRNHASIVIWGVRVNESRTDEDLYKRTTDIAKKLDGTRPCSGSMTSLKPYTADWHEDVYSMDDYHNKEGASGGLEIYEPLPNIPYMISETVGQKSYNGEKGFGSFYYRGGDPQTQALQAIYHAQAHDRAAVSPRMNGVIAWCAFEYPSPANSHNGIKNPGVADHFRLPKLGASFYLAQVDPKVRPVIASNFYWDFGANQPKGPGKQASIFSNCERLELFIDSKSFASIKPDTKNYPHTKFPPSFIDLDFDGTNHPELRIDGYIGSTKVISKSMSSDRSQDQFLVDILDEQLIGDGADATRIAFKVADKFGNDRQLSTGSVKFALTGPGVLVGDNPFDLTAAAGVGAVWIKTQPNSQGKIEVSVTHNALGSKSVSVTVDPYTQPRIV